MKKYQIRLNYSGVRSNDKIKVRGKVAFKTKELHWLHTTQPSIALVSIDSDFHEGLNGEIKMDALLSLIKEYVNGHFSILLADTAHIHTQKIKYQSLAFDNCLKARNLLVKRYSFCLMNYPLLYWSSCICQNKHFDTALAKVQHLYHTDRHFRNLIEIDAEAAYSKKRHQEFPDKSMFIDQAKADIIEQSSSVLVLSELGYRFQFYPGAPYSSTQYVNHTLLHVEKQVHWINVFLSIEKKTVLT
ncbi:MAG: hypothetical protein KDK50_02245 [Chlamydiia bacterium]|nr:hypothetical protein [Chlamydiia bacterium]MCP5491577.1 hypothetical protein [Chlamydiales bacterium]